MRKQGSQKQADENASLTFFDPDDAIFFEKPEEVPSDTPSVIPDDSGIIFFDEE